MEVVTQLPAEEWLAFLDETPGSSIFQSPQMAEVYRRTKGYRPQLVAVIERGRVQALMSSVLLSHLGRHFSGLGTRAVASGGPLGDETLIPSLLQSHDELLSRNTVLTEIRNLQPPSNPEPFAKCGYKWTDHLNFVLDLTKGEKALLQGMSKARRKGIAAADRAGVEVISASRADIASCYRLLKVTYARAEVPLADRSLFENGIELLAPSGLLWVFLAVNDAKVCAVRCVLRWKGTLHDWYAGSSEEGRLLHADERLVWEALCRGIDEQCTAFDFGGAGPPDEPYGPREFKRRFGGTLVNPGRFRRVYRPFVLKLATTSLDLGRRIGWGFG
jgi:lipid II:glycine glycyltransferase (peptidoglycan interpeptide bridge formation enzyme)